METIGSNGQTFPFAHGEIWTGEFCMGPISEGLSFHQDCIRRNPDPILTTAAISFCLWTLVLAWVQDKWANRRNSG